MDRPAENLAHLTDPTPTPLDRRRLVGFVGSAALLHWQGWLCGPAAAMSSNPTPQTVELWDRILGIVVASFELTLGKRTSSASLLRGSHLTQKGISRGHLAGQRGRIRRSSHKYGAVDKFLPSFWVHYERRSLSVTGGRSAPG